MPNHLPSEGAALPPAPLELLAPLTGAEQAIAEAMIGHSFRKPEWLALALTHSSATNASGLNNERIEFLGDSILGLVVAEHLVRTQTSAPEGELTRYRSMVVNTHTLAEVMRGLFAYMLEAEYEVAFGKNARNSAASEPESAAAAGQVSQRSEDGRVLARVSMRALLRLGRGIPANKELPSRIWANMFEAIVGAIYMDAGLAEARSFVLRMLDKTILSVTSPGIETNHKSLLQHITQKFLGGSVRYLIAGQSGPDHEKVFEIQVKVLETLFDPARGKSKREAEQAAASLALRALANDWNRYVVNGMARPADLLPYETVQGGTNSADLSRASSGPDAGMGADVLAEPAPPAYGLSHPVGASAEAAATVAGIGLRDPHRRGPLVRLDGRSLAHKDEVPQAAGERNARIDGHEALGKPEVGVKAGGGRKKRRSRRKRAE